MERTAPTNRQDEATLPVQRVSLRGHPAAIALVVMIGPALCLFFALADAAAPGELIWPVPPDIYAAAIFVATLLILLAAFRIMSQRRTASVARDEESAGSRVSGLIAAAILLVLALCWCARLATQMVAFAGLHPTAIDVPFTVVDTDTRCGRGGGSCRYLLRLRYGAEGRTFSDPVPHATYDAAQEGDVVVLPVETGRFGLQRAMIAARTIGVGELHHPD